MVVSIHLIHFELILTELRSIPAIWLLLINKVLDLIMHGLPLDYITQGLPAEIRILIAFAAIGFGIYLLVKGGGFTVDAVSWIANRLGLSQLFISATLVAVGTSAPELFISVNANLSGFPELSIGNVVGSNIANILLVIGITSIIAPILIDRVRVRVDTTVMIFATVVLSIGMIVGNFNRLGGFFMFLLLISYLIYQFKHSHIAEQETGGNVHFNSGLKAWWMLILGFATMLIGSEVLVNGAVLAGRTMGVDNAIIGLTVIAFSTSLPELTTCIAAARKKLPDIIVGGIIGSNIFNILSIIGLTAIIKQLKVDEMFLFFDLPFVVIATLVFATFLLIVGKIHRFVGILFFVCYFGFVLMQFKDQLFD